MMGQKGFFTKFSPEKVPLGIERYTKEVERLFGVAETRLSKVDYFNGYDFSIADIMIFPWVNVHEWLEVDITKYPSVEKWLKRVAERPAVQRALKKIEEVTNAPKQE
jgi:GST-like protein